MFPSLFTLFGRPALTPVADITARATITRARGAMVEVLEDRQFFSVAPALADPLAAPLKTQTAVFADKVAKNGTTTMLPLQFTGVQLQNGQLVALGQLGSTTFTSPIALATSPNAADTSCPILNLSLGPIHLDLLGLNVDTSRICLDITAEPGSGNLLGNLLCGVSHLLDQGVSLNDILSGLGAQANQLLGGITDLLNSALSHITAPSSVIGVSDSAAGAHCDILNLSLGPIDLNLLGLDVSLDNCANGPVTVDITAVPGAGNLLGNLLCGVTHLLDNPSNPHALANLLSRISRTIGGLL